MKCFLADLTCRLNPPDCPQKLEYLLKGLAGLTVLLSMVAARGADRQTLHDRHPAAWARLQSVGHLAGTNHLKVAIGLPLRNGPALTALLQQINDPTSANFRHYLTSAQFAERYSPTEHDYQAVIRFAEANGLTVAGTHRNRLLLDVNGSVADLERVFHVGLRLYPHPKQERTFYAPDKDPSVELEVPLLHVSGLNNYSEPHPMQLREAGMESVPAAAPHAGSGPSGYYMGSDFRAAYVPGTPLTGAGQRVGLFELGGYYASDIAAYESQAGLPKVPLKNVLIDGFNGSPGRRRPGSLNEEVALDIEMVISMAPGLSEVLVYEGSPSGDTATINDVLNRMATDNLAQQLSCSWGFDIDVTSQQIFQQFAAQGQSFFMASGDSGAENGAIVQPSDNPYITVVGGTDLTTDKAHAWKSESTWSGSSGGRSTVYPIPMWQEGIDMSANGGSTRMRNMPDVAMVANNIFAIADQGRTLQLAGTSIAAPLWAGFTALANEQAAASGKAPVGFVNPVLYAISKGKLYSSTFHDITIGNTTNRFSPDRFFAVPGYDLCTGLGTPVGTNLIRALLDYPGDSLRITPPLGMTAVGPVGGPFQIASESYALTNTGIAPLNWMLANNSPWLDVSPSSGTLNPGDPPLAVTVSVNTNSNQILIGSYIAEVWFTNLNTGVGQNRPVDLRVGNGDFEAGNLSGWTFSGDTNNSFANSIDSSQFFGSSSLPGVDDSLFAHSGLYGAFLGENTALGFLAQTLPTVPGQSYLVSFWLINPAVGVPNQFQVAWNGVSLFDQSDMDSFGWTNLQFIVEGTGTSSVLQFGFRNDPNAFGLDDISVQPLLAPSLESVSQLEDSIAMRWHAIAGLQYQVQYATDLNSAVWTNLGTTTATTATHPSVTATDGIASGPQRFYRILLTR